MLDGDRLIIEYAQAKLQALAAKRDKRLRELRLAIILQSRKEQAQ